MSAIAIQENIGAIGSGNLQQSERYQMPTPFSADKPDVCLAYDSVQRCAVVIKSFQSRSKANNELAALRRVSGHPNIVRLLDCFLTECIFGPLYSVVLEYAERGTLLDYLSEQPGGRLPDERLTALLFRQITGALCFCHERGIAHGDLNLNNILIHGDGRLLLCDFGLAVDVRRSGTSYQPHFCGTLAYLAPEIVCSVESGRNIAFDVLAADVWALGVCLWAAIFGVPPFDDPCDEHMLKMIGACQLFIPPAPSISADLRNLFSQILLRDPAYRLTARKLSEHRFFNSE